MAPLPWQTTPAAPASPTGTGPLTIVQLTASNVKRLKAITIRPDGAAVVIGGRNGAGKSSVLDSIAMALGGAATKCPDPVRHGEDRAEIVVDLGEIVVRRTFDAGGTSKLEVTTPEGAKFSSPQALLDKLCTELAFDPLAFARDKPRDQAETLRKLVGLDFGQADTARAESYAERTRVNARTKALASRVAAMPDLGAPVPDVAFADVLAARDEAARTNAANAAVRAQVVSLQRHLKTATAERDRLQQMLTIAETSVASAATELAAAETACVAAADIDLAQFDARISQAEAATKRNAAARERARLAADRDASEKEAKELTKTIDRIDEWKAQQIAAAAMPIAGLSFSADGGVTFGGVPFEQASQAERLRASVAIGLAMNPRLRVLLIRDASLLDTDGLRMVAEMAEAAGAQVWLERVEHDMSTTVLIEDGEVVTQEAAS